MARSVLRSTPAWVLMGLTLGVLYVPLLPPLLLAKPGRDGVSPYANLLSDANLSAAVRISLLLALQVAIVTAPLALLGAMAVRRSKYRRLLVLVMLVPLFVPAVSVGLAEALFFRMLHIEPSMFTMLVVQVIWAVPFSFLIVLATMSTFDPVYLEAAYVNGANPVRAFLNVEFPLIRSGVIGAAMFAAVLSLNETIRTSLVQGPFNTLQTYIWATYTNVGISPALYALMSLLIVGTLVLLLVFAGVSAFRSSVAAARDKRSGDVA